MANFKLIGANLAQHGVLGNRYRFTTYKDFNHYTEWELTMSEYMECRQGYETYFNEDK